MRKKKKGMMMTITSILIRMHSTRTDMSMRHKMIILLVGVIRSYFRGIILHMSRRRHCFVRFVFLFVAMHSLVFATSAHLLMLLVYLTFCFAYIFFLLSIMQGNKRTELKSIHHPHKHGEPYSPVDDFHSVMIC